MTQTHAPVRPGRDEEDKLGGKGSPMCRTEKQTTTGTDIRSLPADQPAETNMSQPRTAPRNPPAVPPMRTHAPKAPGRWVCSNRPRSRSPRSCSWPRRAAATRRKSRPAPARLGTVEPGRADLPPFLGGEVRVCGWESGKCPALDHRRVSRKGRWASRRQVSRRHAKPPRRLSQRGPPAAAASRAGVRPSRPPPGRTTPLLARDLLPRLDAPYRDGPDAFRALNHLPLESYLAACCPRRMWYVRGARGGPPAPLCSTTASPPSPQRPTSATRAPSATAGTPSQTPKNPPPSTPHAPRCCPGRPARLGTNLPRTILRRPAVAG